MNRFDHIFLAMSMGLLVAVSSVRAFRRVSRLQGEKKILTRNMLISVFWGVIGASGAALAIVIWSVTHDSSNLVFAAVGAVIVVVCSVYFLRSYVPLRKSPSQKH